MIHFGAKGVGPEFKGVFFRGVPQGLVWALTGIYKVFIRVVEGSRRPLSSSTWYVFN